MFCANFNIALVIILENPINNIDAQQMLKLHQIDTSITAWLLLLQECDFGGIWHKSLFIVWEL